MKASQITQWLLGALLVITIALTSMVWNANTERFDRTDRRLDQIEERLANIQAQYGQITEVKATVTAQGQQLDRIEKWIYERIK